MCRERFSTRGRLISFALQLSIGRWRYDQTASWDNFRVSHSWDALRLAGPKPPGDEPPSLRTGQNGIGILVRGRNLVSGNSSNAPA